jgi:hypothetical protein
MSLIGERYDIRMTKNEALRILVNVDQGLLDDGDPQIRRVIRRARVVASRRRPPREPLTPGPRLEKHITRVSLIVLGLAGLAVVVPVLLMLRA